jgi:hypothetical protein
MKPAACLPILLPLSAAACAGEADGLVGEPGCRVARLMLEENASVLWKGACKDGYADGPGVLERFQRVLTYAGSGRKREAEFDNGMVRGAAPPPSFGHDRYALEKAPLGLDLLRASPTTGPFPFDKSYGELTPAQQALVKSQYPALEDGDEPPIRCTV